VLSFNIAIFCSKTLRRKENLIINFICLTRDEKEKESSFIEKEKERERRERDRERERADGITTTKSLR